MVYHAAVLPWRMITEAIAAVHIMRYPGGYRHTA